MHSKSLTLFVCGASLLNANCAYAAPPGRPVTASSATSTDRGKVVQGHQFLGWHSHYHNATVFVGKDKALFDNGICKFVLTANAPDKLIVYDSDGNTYVDLTPAQWYKQQCGDAPSKYLRTSLSGKDRLFDVPCKRYDCFNPSGKLKATYWATDALGSDIRLTNAIAVFLGLPINCGLPLKLQIHAQKYDRRYISRDAPRKKNAIYELAGKSTMVEMIPVAEEISFALLKSHTVAQRPLKDFLLPANAKRAKSIADLIYGDAGEITEGSVDLWMRSPMKKNSAKPAK
ncbi:MAG: hypothetical protein IT342_25090 [Candidatus Melainabacteria bacterium]|nr:hypothetical protein [Candidatus Melainabacteria bacterium]